MFGTSQGSNARPNKYTTSYSPLSTSVLSPRAKQKSLCVFLNRAISIIIQLVYYITKPTLARLVFYLILPYCLVSSKEETQIILYYIYRGVCGCLKFNTLSVSKYKIIFPNLIIRLRILVKLVINTKLLFIYYRL